MPLIYCAIGITHNGNGWDTYGIPISKRLFWISCFPSMMMLSWMQSSIRHPPGAHCNQTKPEGVKGLRGLILKFPCGEFPVSPCAHWPCHQFVWDHRAHWSLQICAWQGISSPFIKLHYGKYAELWNNSQSWGSYISFKNIYYIINVINIMQCHHSSSNLMSPTGEENLQSCRDFYVSFIVKPWLYLSAFKGIPTAFPFMREYV